MDERSSEKSLPDIDSVLVELDWPTKDRILANLNKHSAVLYSKKLSNKTKDAMIAENRAIVQILMDLPVKQDGMKAVGSNQLYSELTWSFKERVISSLIKNHNFALLHRELITKEAKMQLIKENNELNAELINLSPVNDDDYECVGYEDDASGSTDQTELAECEPDANKEPQVFERLQSTVRRLWKNSKIPKYVRPKFQKI